MFGPSQRLLKIFFLVLYVIGFYFLARLEFLLWNWNIFHTKPLADLIWAFIVGIRFDISGAICSVAPVLLLSFVPWPANWDRLWQTVSWVIFCIIGIPFLILNLIDTEFINFVGRRFTYDTIFILNEAQGKVMGFVSTYWLLFIINTLLVILFAWGAKKILQAKWSAQWPTQMASTTKSWIMHGVFCFLAIAVSVLGIRGGLQSKPINFVNANVFTAPLLNNLVLNSTFTFIKSFGAKEIKHDKYFAKKEDMLKYLNGYSTIPSLLEGHRPSKPQNVVIIILESFGLEYVGPVNGKTYTPFLDSLMKKSLNFSNGYANGRRSIEGVAAVMGGIPAMMSEPFISSHFTANYFLGLGTMLSSKKYSTSFFHGGHNGTMYFDSFMKSAGVDKYYGASEYANSADDDGVWGIWDEPFLQFMISKVNQLPQPFMTSVFTLSSHHPFKVPEKYKDRFPEGETEILKTVAYTDYSLQRFFEEAEKQPWYKDTLFIFTADHTTKHYRSEFDNEIGDYRVPLFLYHPTYQFPKVDTTTVVQQIDVLPTVLDFLNIPAKEENYLGSSMFVPGDKVAVSFIDGRYLLAAKDYQLRWALGHADPVMYAIDDVNGTKPLDEPAARKSELTLRMKAAIQYFNEGMWDNKLYYPTLRK